MRYIGSDDPSPAGDHVGPPEEARPHRRLGRDLTNHYLLLHLQLKPRRLSSGGSTCAEFTHEILNEIARCLNMPFNVAAGNSSGYNYASGRLDHQTYFKAIRVKQVHLEAVVLDRILAAWLDEGRQTLVTSFVSRWFCEVEWNMDGNDDTSDSSQSLHPCSLGVGSGCGDCLHPPVGITKLSHVEFRNERPG